MPPPRLSLPLALRRSAPALLGAGLLGLTLGTLPGCLAPEPREPVVRAPTAPLSSACPAVPDVEVEHRVRSADELAGALATVQPGEAVVLDGVDLSEGFLLPSGTPGAPVLLRGEQATLRGTLSLEGAHDVVIAGISFVSDGTVSWLAGDGAARVDLVGNGFDIDCLGCGDQFYGARLTNAEDLTFCGNRFGWWMGDMLSFEPAERVLFEANDLGQSGADHTVLGFVGRDLVVRDNLFRNPWDRVLHVASFEPDVVTEGVVVEGNAFLDSDWDRRRYRPVADADVASDGGGAYEVVRLNGVGHLFRDNLVLHNRRGNGWECHAALTFTTWENAPYRNLQNRHHRVYGNTFVGNELSAVGLADSLDTGAYGDNLVAHNIFTRQGHAAVAVCTDVFDAASVTLVENLLDPDERVDLAGEEARPVAEAAAAHPEVLVDNTLARPAFVDGGALDERLESDVPLSLEDLARLRTAYALVDGPVATPLARLRADAVATDQLAVDDAAWFSDGRGVVEGDEIEVAGQRARVVEVDREGGRLVVDGAITAEVGEGVALVGRAVGVGAWGARLDEAVR